MKKYIFAKLIMPWFKWISYLFYDKKYLTGKHFHPPSLEGWLWVIRGLWQQKILGFNRQIPFPCASTARIHDYHNIHFHPNELHNFQSPGIYFDAVQAKIFIGAGTFIGPYVGLLTANHQVYNLEAYDTGKDIILGKNCWLGMHAVILPGVTLGNHTIVGAGAVVTQSFPQGHCIIGGIPAKIIRNLHANE